MATGRIAPKADQPRITTGELDRAVSKGAGGTLQYKNVDVRVSPTKQPMRSMRAMKKT